MKRNLWLQITVFLAVVATVFFNAFNDARSIAGPNGRSLKFLMPTRRK